MSKEIISQVMQQTCDGCGTKKAWDLVGATPAHIVEMQEWYGVQRKVVVNGQLVQLSADACSLACVPAAAVKLALPKTEAESDEPSDGIDLAALGNMGRTN